MVTKIDMLAPFSSLLRNVVHLRTEQLKECQSNPTTLLSMYKTAIKSDAATVIILQAMKEFSTPVYFLTKLE